MGTVTPGSVLTMAGNSFTIPTPSAVEGYTFAGWCTDAELTTSAGTTYTPSANSTLYGKWDVNPYYLTYDYQDEYTYYGDRTLDTGYVVDWDRSFKIEAAFKVGTLGKRYAIFSNYSSGTTTVSLEVTTANKLRVYMGNGNVTNYADDKSTESIVKDEVINVIFEWNADTNAYTLTATGTTVNISMSKTIATNMTGLATRTFLIGRDYRTTTFGQIDISKVKISEKRNYNEVVSTFPTATKTGFTYNGWFAATTGGTALTSVTIPAQDITIYAQKTENTYTIAFNNNGGTGTMSSLTGVRYTETKALTSNSFTKTGYTFKGWATSQANANAGTVAYANGASVKELSATNGATVTLWAAWKDETAPVANDISVTATLKSASQTATISATDGVGVVSYYWDTTSPTDGSTFTETTSTANFSTTKTINTAGTYYFAVKDSAGNMSNIKSVVINSYAVQNLLEKNRWNNKYTYKCKL